MRNFGRFIYYVAPMMGGKKFKTVGSLNRRRRKATKKVVTDVIHDKIGIRNEVTQ